MLGQLYGEGFEQGFSPGKDDVHWPEPTAEIDQNLRPLRSRRRVFLASVLPDVAVDAPCITEFGEEENGRYRTAMRRKAATRESPQAIVDAFVKSSIDMIPGRHDHRTPPS
jgi:hypothetical protein